MELVTGYGGKAHITPENWADLNRGFSGMESYVTETGRKFEAELISNNLLKIHDGCGIMQGRQVVIPKGQSDEVTIQNGTQGMKRIDLVVERYTKNPDTKIETTETVLIKGTPSTNPTVPAYTVGDIRSGDMKADWPLYEVELDGINVVEVRPVFKVLFSIDTINTYLLDSSYELLKTSTGYVKKYANGIFESWAKAAIKNAREEIAKCINAKPSEIFFTSGGTEADNWAIKETYEAYKEKGNHIITTKVEHHAVLHTCQWLEKQGFEVTYVNVDKDGVIKLDELEAAIRPDTILISVMAANNEIGTIQPLREIGELAHKHGVLFHTDAVQAFAHIPINVDEMHIDMLSASGHKIHGPKGIGVMYIRKGVKILSFMHGGAQERHRRAGTHNVPGIVGMGKAVEIASRTMEENGKKIAGMRDYLIEQVLEKVPYARLNGHRTDRLPNNANFCFRFIEGEGMLILLDQAGIYGSSGSACTSGSLDPSHVLLAIGLPHEIAHGSLRLTLSEETTKEDIDYTVDKLAEIIARLRSMSPLYEDFVKKHGDGK